jgi:hypothetical protein
MGDNKKLFDWIYGVIIEEGGDGDAVIGFMIQDYYKVAAEMRQYFPESWNMEIGDDNITFTDNQEYITLTSVVHFEKIKNYGPRILTW